ncbi:hypothetical protein McpAg1_06360 [Methanocorpusculaceae archaeon Ag1]|uniref:Uncharacterized protein n=1 Tax=Methanorbis furvi TaxID=3028299 RepID=A0AAE4MBQ9_9EURY|nr:hypothetical protein [Methanocorpusculaceae archaeon Ag1]
MHGEHGASLNARRTPAAPECTEELRKRYSSALFYMEKILEDFFHLLCSSVHSGAAGVLRAFSEAP